MAKVKLDDMVNTVSSAIDKSNANIDKAVQEKVDRYFDEDEHGNLVPRKLRIKRSERADDFVDIDEFALYTNSKAMRIEEATISFKIKASKIFSQEGAEKTKPQIHVELAESHKKLQYTKRVMPNILTLKSIRMLLAKLINKLFE